MHSFLEHSWTKQVRLDGTKHLRSLSTKIFLLAFALQLYWAYPMVSFFHYLQAAVSDPWSLTPELMTSILTKLQEEYRKEKIRDGVLVAGPPGQHPCSNPSERRPGWVKFKTLIKDWAAWRKCSNKLAILLSEDGGTVGLGQLLSELENANLESYTGNKMHYASVRFMRSLMHTSHTKFADSEGDWDIFRSMTKHVKEQIHAFGIDRYRDAIAMRNSMRQACRTAGRGYSHRLIGYSLSDLVIFVCLIKNKKKD